MPLDSSDFDPEHPLETWVAVNTQPHREHTAIEHLTRQGYASYCPRVRRRVSHARRTQEVLRPFFPGYVFVDLARGPAQWRPILSTVGVRTVVRIGDRLGRVPSGLIHGLRMREVDGAIMPLQAAFAVGQTVRIAGGAFEGLIGRVLELGERDRLVVLMDLLNQSVRVKLNAQQVTTVD